MSDRPKETEYSALQALLQISTNSERNTGEITAHDAANANANQNAKIANLLRMGGASTASLLQQRGQLSFSPTQLAAFRSAGGSAAALPPASSFGRTGLLQASAMQNSALAAAAAAASARGRYPSLVAVAAFATAPRTQALGDMPRSPVQSPLRPAARGIPQGGAISPTAQSVDSIRYEAEGTEAEKMIRKNEVEAALRSKPQRGRKRENLNAEERLELTRTRNREHAKSTRIRKKARYQELLDTEQKFLELKNMEGLDSKRRETVMGFLEARAQMLGGNVDSFVKPCNQVSPGEAVKTGDETGESRAISSDQTDASGRKTGAESLATPKGRLKGDDDNSSNLKDFLENEENFGFETSMSDIHVRDATAMTLFDENVARRYEHLFGTDSSCRIYYRVIGSSTGIALNQDGTGFAKVEHVVAGDQKQASMETANPKVYEKVLLTSLVSFQFAGGSPLLSSVSWCVLKDALGTSPCESVNGSKSVSTGKESLESQTVYPSVVSFDETHRARDRQLNPPPPHQRRGEYTEQMEETAGMTF